MRNSAGPDDVPDTAPDQHVRPRHVAPLRTANDRTARLGLERPPTTAEFHTRPLDLPAGGIRAEHAQVAHTGAHLCERGACRRLEWMAREHGVEAVLER